ncbi:MAG: hypothetical protein KBD06_00145 [Candidatus Pacebacteria bacterium]|nr:hypothetical protein [Candidatus Paceibacterota bacterium]
MLDALRQYVLPILFATLVLLGFSAYGAQKATVVAFERPVPTYEQVVEKEVLMSNPDELLPDLVPMPATDLKIAEAENGDLRLLFSTTYLNQGRGTLELRADPKTAGVRADIDRDVLQRIYFKDGGSRDKVVGNFLWHQTHLHYHYQDFIVYDLAVEGGENLEDLSGILQKSTFCLRDISRILSPVEGKKEEATYKICGKELQGVSVGWGDTYYFDYPDQALNIESLPSGTYRLTFIANPERRLDELAYSNNTSYVIFNYDREKRTVEVTKEFPENLPEIEHVHLDDPFGL